MKVVAETTQRCLEKQLFRKFERWNIPNFVTKINKALWKAIITILIEVAIFFYFKL